VQSPSSNLRHTISAAWLRHTRRSSPNPPTIPCHIRSEPHAPLASSAIRTNRGAYPLARIMLHKPSQGLSPPQPAALEKYPTSIACPQSRRRQGHLAATLRQSPIPTLSPCRSNPGQRQRPGSRLLSIAYTSKEYPSQLRLAIQRCYQHSSPAPLQAFRPAQESS